MGWKLARKITCGVAVAGAMAVATPPVFATSASASTTGPCTSGYAYFCAFRNVSYTPPSGRIGSNVPVLDSWYYYGTTVKMGDTVSSAYNYTSCKYWLYGDTYYNGSSFYFPAGSQSNMTNTTVGNDNADSVYRIC